MKARSLDVLASLLADGRSAGTFDVAYVDGSHAARDVIGDGVMCWELLRRGGVVVFDDYRWDAVMGDAVPGQAVPEDGGRRLLRDVRGRAGGAGARVPGGGAEDRHAKVTKTSQD